MSDTYVSALLAVAVAGAVARLSLAALPIRRYVVRLSVLDVLVVVVGSLGLFLHCGAMFFRTSVAGWPGGPTVIRVVDPMGTASIVWYAVAAALVVAGLRRQQPLVVGVVAVSLAAGMEDEGISPGDIIGVGEDRASHVGRLLRELIPSL